MERGNWGRPERVWGLEPYYDPGRMIEIYGALREKNWKSLVDVACGVGLIAEGLSWVFTGREIEQFDIEPYPEWRYLKIKPREEDVMQFIKQGKKYDVVLFLNSYRNWDTTSILAFNKWLRSNAKYFITSGENMFGGEIIGMDVKHHPLKLYTL